MGNKRLGYGLVLTMLMSGCSMAPGMYMEQGGLFGAALTKTENAEQRYELIPITHRLIAAQQYAASAPGMLPQELLGYQPTAYRVGVNDVLMITVWGHPDLSPSEQAGGQADTPANGRLVRHDGSIFVPYAGVLQVAGLTLEEIRKLISQRLSAVLEAPQVDINVLKFGSQQVVVAGALSRAGRIPLTTQPLNLLEAIAQAGGPLPNADYSEVRLIRDGKTYVFDLNQVNPELYSLYLKDGDSLYVPTNELKKVYVVGEVNKPLAYAFARKSLSLAEVLGNAGGIRPETASGKEVYVIRGLKEDNQQPDVIYQLNADSPAAFALAAQFELQPQDVVFVGAAQITRWNRVISQIFPSLNLLRTSQAVVQ